MADLATRASDWAWMFRELHGQGGAGLWVAQIADEALAAGDMDLHRLWTATLVTLDVTAQMPQLVSDQPPATPPTSPAPPG